MQDGLHLRIPASVAEALRLPPDEREPALRHALAVALYAQELLSFGKARELADLDKATFAQLLGRHQVARHYGRAELDEDLRYTDTSDEASA